MGRTTVVIRDSGSSYSSGGYGCMHFLFDLFMVCATGGLWFLWIWYRAARRG